MALAETKSHEAQATAEMTGKSEEARATEAASRLKEAEERARVAEENRSLVEQSRRELEEKLKEMEEMQAFREDECTAILQDAEQRLSRMISPSRLSQVNKRWRL